MKRIIYGMIVSLFLFLPTITAAELTTGWYSLSPSNNLTVRLNVDSGKASATSYLKRANNTSGQKFYLQKQTDGSFKIGTGTTVGVSVLGSDKNQQKWSNTAAQKWTIAPSGDYFTIKNKSTGNYLSFNGTTLNVNTTASLWKLQPYSEKHTVTFTDGYGKTLKRQSVANGKSATAPTAPTRSGKTFICWDKTFDNVKANMVVNAVWEYTVIYTDGEKEISRQKVDVGKKPVSPDFNTVAKKISNITVENNNLVKTVSTYNSDGTTTSNLKWQFVNWSLKNENLTVDKYKTSEIIVTPTWQLIQGSEKDKFGYWRFNDKTDVYWICLTREPKLYASTVPNTGDDKVETPSSMAKKANGRYVINGGTSIHYPVFSDVWRSEKWNANRPYYDSLFLANGKLETYINPYHTGENATKALENIKSQKPKWVVGGFDALILDGKKVTNYSTNDYDNVTTLDTDRAARTFIGQLENGKYFIGCSEGNYNNNNSAGLTYSELCDFVNLKIGSESNRVKFLFNLDGGGTSGFIYRGIKINNKKDDNGQTERKCNSILYFE